MFDDLNANQVASYFLTTDKYGKRPSVLPDVLAGVFGVFFASGLRNMNRIRITFVTEGWPE